MHRQKAPSYSETRRAACRGRPDRCQFLIYPRQRLQVRRPESTHAFQQRQPLAGNENAPQKVIHPVSEGSSITDFSVCCCCFESVGIRKGSYRKKGVCDLKSVDEGKRIHRYPSAYARLPEWR